MRTAFAASVLIGTALAAGCYDTPKPPCSFLCGENLECPADYACDPTDNRCKMRVGGVFATCEDLPLPDAGEIDAPVADAGGPDGPASTPDAGGTPDGGAPDGGSPATTHTGTISITDVSIQDHPELGHGGNILIDFIPVGGPGPVYDDRVPPGVGCAAWSYDISSGVLPLAGVDEGAVTITGSTAAVPACTFYAGLGYLCVAGGGSGAAGDVITANAGGPGVAALTDAATSGYLFSAVDVGRYVSITGAVNPPNNGAFPIVAVNTGTNTVLYGNPLAMNESFIGGYTILAGEGPVPGAPPPEFLGDADSLMVTLTPGGDMDFDGFTATVSAGDAFALDAASAIEIVDMPLDGTATSLSCDSAGGMCGSSIISIVSITSTDGAIPPGAPGYYFPSPIDRFVTVTCAGFGTTISIPAGVMSEIMAANPTRIRTGFFRDNFMPQQNADGTNGTNVVVGHGIFGFTSPPPPPPPDAGVPDASVPDAAAPGVPDASPPDAAPPIPDASPPDALVCAPALAPTDDPGATAQDLVLSEINPGNYIELYNNTASTFALSGSPYWLCSPFTYTDLSTLGAGMTIAAGSYLVVPWPMFFSDVDAGGEVILYNSSLFADSSAIVDFVCWGTNPHASRKAQAESAGKWATGGACAPAITGGAIHRLVATDGVNAADYDTSLPANGQTCTP